VLSCKSLVHQASDFTDKNLSWRQALSIKVHLLMCVHCRRFMKHFKTTIKVGADIAQQQDKPSAAEVSKVVEAIEKLDQNSETGKGRP
jgi:anti-sigma factor ChrR (cupin superfamily)